MTRRSQDQRGSTERSAVALVCLALAGSCAGAALATMVARALDAKTFLLGAAGTALGALASCALFRRRLAMRLPAELDGWFRRRRLASALWMLVAIVAVANTARLSLFVADPTQIWASAFPPVRDSAGHQCLAAYVRAAELSAGGQANLWNPADYAAPSPSTDAAPSTNAAAPADSHRVRGLVPYLADPFEYPPTFVVLPRAAIAATDDYQLVRAAWFGLSAVGFWAAFVGLAIWIRGRAGATALLLAPALALSFPVTFNLQFGQAHLLVVATAIAGMLQLTRGRLLSGGLCLGFATVSKIFPGLLLVHLAVRRRWRALAATLAAIAALIALAAVVLGPGTWRAFLSEHLPRMASGEAFAFTEHNPDNHSLYGLAFKLADLGVAGADRSLASLLAWVWGLAALLLAVLGSRGRAEPARDAVVWLGIVFVATLRSPFAPMYTAVGTLWLLAVAVGVMAPRRWLTAAIAICWVLLQGFPPMLGPAGNALASLPSQAASIAIAVLAVWQRRTPPLTAAPRA